MIFKAGDRVTIRAGHGPGSDLCFTISEIINDRIYLNGFIGTFNHDQLVSVECDYRPLKNPVLYGQVACQGPTPSFSFASREDAYDKLMLLICGVRDLPDSVSAYKNHVNKFIDRLAKSND